MTISRVWITAISPICPNCADAQQVFPVFGLGAILDGYSMLALILGGLMVMRGTVLWL